MKKILFIAASWLLTTMAAAQTLLPMDSAIKFGVLDNGLTYYVRHNEEPKGQAEFFIAQKVGSMQEEDNQRGLAHFLEHMCFNGTRNFPGKNLVNYLESIGVAFGRNLNAYTSFDETVYNISAVPVSREGIIDSCLLALHDWSHDLLLEDSEIDAERGVIHEEWRTGNAYNRLYTDLLPQIFPGCRYGYRMPIGVMEVVDNFPYEVIRDYYHTWYRPDLQAILVIGDIDADAVVEKIKRTFADIELPAERKERIYEPVDDNVEPIVGIVSDKELTVNRMSVMWKTKPMPDEWKPTDMGFVFAYVKQAISSMFSVRISEIMQKSNPPFLGAGLSLDEFMFAKTKDATTLDITYADGGMETAARAALAELMRVVRHGFTVSEYERFRTNYMRQYEQYYAEREKRTSNEYAREYVRNFIDHEAIPGIEAEYQLMNLVIAPNIPVETINQLAETLVSDSNMVVTLMATATERQHEKEQLLAIVNESLQADVEPYMDEVIDRPLMENTPTGAAVVKEEEGFMGSRLLTLSNGVRVVLKATDFQADEISVSGFRTGGTNQFEDADVEQATWINQLHSVMGIGDFSALDLQKALTGKHVSVDAGVNTYTESVDASCSVRDIETMLQLISLQFTPMRIDEEALSAFRQRTRALLENQQADPMTSFSDTLQLTMASNKARVVSRKPEIVDRIDVNRVKELYDSRFDHADGFTFTIVGNIEGMEEQIVQYLGALPVKGVEDKDVERGPNFRHGQYENQFEREMEMDRSTVYMIVQGDAELTLDNRVAMSAFSLALRKRLLDKMREEAGATYSPGVGGQLSPDISGAYAILYVVFETSPEMRETLIQIARDEIARIAEEGVDDEQIDKSRQYMVKEYTEGLRKNDALQNKLYMYYRHGLDTDSGYTDIVNALSGERVKEFARAMTGQKNEVLVSMSKKK